MKPTNSRKNTLGLALCLGALVAAGGVQAHGGFKGPSHRFQKLDTDGSGGLSLTEMEAGAMVRFVEGVKRKEARKAKRAARMQEKGLTEADLAAKKEARKARKEAWLQANPEKAARIKKFGKRGKRPQLDTDGDGAVSAEEITAAATKRFQTLDKDADGSVSEGEWAAARKGKRGKRGKWGKRRHRRGRGHKGRCGPDQDAQPESTETGEG